MRRKELKGRRFGTLTVIEWLGCLNGKNGVWLCKCDCGEEAKITTTHLTSGHSKSCCKCRNKKIAIAGTKTRFKEKHGLSRTRIYRIWSGMRDRCYNPNNSKAHVYYVRGIGICAEWKSNFKAFYDWAMANGYKDNLTIDRIDNEKGYSPTNCRWATIAEQNRNRRCCLPPAELEALKNSWKG